MSDQHKRLFIFGSTGDLVKRKVLPALMELKGVDLSLITLGRKDFSSGAYRDFVHGENDSIGPIRKHAYARIDFKSDNVCEDCLIHLDEKSINYFYSALPPANIEDVILYVSKLKQDGYKVSLLLEKPFGSSLKDSIRLQKLIKKEKMNKDIFISDHYLFKKEIINLKQNSLKNDLKIVSLEDVGLENRITYYDDIGALKDMIQSHFLNIVFKLIRNPAKDMKDFRVISYERAQYGDGIKTGYVKDLGKPSDTETFVRVVASAGERTFEFITGKKFDKKMGYLSIDGKYIPLENSDNPYVLLFDAYLSGKYNNLVTAETSIFGWKLTELIIKRNAELTYYKPGKKVLEYVFPEHIL